GELDLRPDAVGRRHEDRVGQTRRAEEPAEGTDIADDLGPLRASGPLAHAPQRVLFARVVDAYRLPCEPAHAGRLRRVSAGARGSPSTARAGPAPASRP